MDDYEAISRMRTLARGWNGYDAEPPSDAAADRATDFLRLLARESFTPDRLAPSAVGGIGLTFRRDRPGHAYVEFMNDGEVFALFSNGRDEPESRRVEPTDEGYRGLVGEIRAFLGR